MAITDFAAIGRAFRVSCKGLSHCLRHERAVQQEAVLFILLTLVAAFLAESAWHWLLLTAPLILILIVEVLNTGLEAAIDRIGPEHHELSGLAKDCGSAAVLLSMLLAGLVWGVFLFERFFR
ncbi:diacylglycerol kinase [Kiloniella laminariae]|uniref:Diacylglycerol kinase n=1 Tax=Kiloniella laminariae TaxID=454162 RepID=A0ABT4LHG9_9PROT|nr:diacylglycerol kinase [Kiloniella laminariae]MCZ4279462.1 diacylglycerol kinase [Kiloniella laminariae]